MAWGDRLKGKRGSDDESQTAADLPENAIARVAWDEFNRGRDLPFDPRGYGIGRVAQKRLRRHTR